MGKHQELTFVVEGMTCDHCARSIEQALTAVPGVTASSADYPSGRVRVTAAATIDEGAVAAAITNKGYRVVAPEQQPKPVRLAATGADLLIIGSGAAGVAAAIRASELGARALLIERGVLGGTCVNLGCVPSKTLIRAASLRHHARQHGFLGVETSAGAVDLATVIGEKRRLVTTLRKEKYQDVLAAYPGVEVVKGEARLQSDGVVALDGEPVRAGNILIATGAEPAIPPIAGLASVPFLTSTSAMELEALPAHLIVIGAGYIALELAQAFARFGSRVTVLARSRLLRGEDEELTTELAKLLGAEGIDVRLSARVVEVSGTDGDVRVTVDAPSGREVINGDQLLVATGRTPRTAGLGLAEAAVKLGAGGHVVVDERLESTRPGVYAAGDVTDGPAFVYVAAYAGRVAADNALTEAGPRYDVSLVPRVTFTDPAVASIGVTEAEARKRRLDIEVTRFPMSQVPRAIAARDTRGLIKLVIDKSSRVLVGVHMLAPEAGDLLGEAALAMRLRVPVDEIAKIFHPYLTNAEAFKLACQSFTTDVKKLSCCA